jgi:hypothetical protein
VATRCGSAFFSGKHAIASSTAAEHSQRFLMGLSENYATCPHWRSASHAATASSSKLHALHYRAFVEEIPQHPRNDAHLHRRPLPRPERLRRRGSTASAWWAASHCARIARSRSTGNCPISIATCRAGAASARCAC